MLGAVIAQKPCATFHHCSLIFLKSPRLVAQALRQQPPVPTAHLSAACIRNHRICVSCAICSLPQFHYLMVYVNNVCVCNILKWDFDWFFMMPDMHSVLAQLHRDTAYVTGIRITRNWREKWKIKDVRSQIRTINSSGNSFFSVVKSKLLILRSMSLMRKWKFPLPVRDRCLHSLVLRAGNSSRLPELHMDCPQG